MPVQIWQLVVLGGLTLFPPLINIIILYSKKQWSDKLLHPMLGISAGLLLGIVLLDLLPGSFNLASDEKIDTLYVSLMAMSGFFALLLAERYLLGRGGLAYRGHEAEGTKIRPFGILGVSALVVHGFMDGVVIPLGLSIGAKVGLAITIAIIIHQIPDSFAAMSIGLSGGFDRKKALYAISASALDTPIGIFFGAILTNYGSRIVLMGMGFSIGTFMFVSAADIVPEIQHKAKSKTVVFSILAGFLLVFILTQFLPDLG